MWWGSEAPVNTSEGSGVPLNVPKNTHFQTILACQNALKLQSQAGGVLGAVPSAAVSGHHSKCIISCVKVYRHQKYTANA